jgi:quercetin dioxygenase-like cupin family protein
MCFTTPGAKFSMHFHSVKEETWFVNAGQFLVRWIDTATAELHEKVLKEGDTWHNPPLQPHQLQALVANSMILEVSTADSVEDNYRVGPGDSQNKKEKNDEPQENIPG